MTRFWPLLGASALFVVLAFACKGDGGTPKGETPASSPALAPTPKTYSERPAVTIGADKKYSAVVETTKGKFTIELRPDIAIQTVNSFIFLAREGFYNGVTFHRVHQRGCPMQASTSWRQTGDPTAPVPAAPLHACPREFSDVPYERGTVGMARVGTDINSAGSQWFVTYTDKYQRLLKRPVHGFRQGGGRDGGRRAADAPRPPERRYPPAGGRQDHQHRDQRGVGALAAYASALRACCRYDDRRRRCGCYGPPDRIRH